MKAMKLAVITLAVIATVALLDGSDCSRFSDQPNNKLERITLAQFNWLGWMQYIIKPGRENYDVFHGGFAGCEG